VFVDLNENEVQDGNETEILPSVTVTLVIDTNDNGVLDDDDVVLTSTETDDTGEYFFFDVDPTEDYLVVVDETDPDFDDDRFEPVPVIPVGPNNGGVVLTPGQESEANIPAVPITSVTGFMFVDVGGDGAFNTTDGDYPFANVTVTLSDEFGNVIATTTTGPDGSYTFASIDPTLAQEGSLVVVSVDADGVNDFELTVPGIDSDLDFGESNETFVGAVVLTSDGSSVVDGGFVPFLCIGDFVWDDLNRDGCQDGAEPGLSGAQIQLIEQISNEVIAVATTDELGFFQFTSYEGVRAGTLYLCRLVLDQTVVLDYVPAPSNAVCDSEEKRQTQVVESQTRDSDGVYDDELNALDAFLTTLEPGDCAAAFADFGLMQAREFTLVVFDDENQNGLQDANEGPLVGVPVSLIAGADSNLPPGTVIATLTTDASGILTFSERDIPELGDSGADLQVVIGASYLTSASLLLSPQDVTPIGGELDSDARYGSAAECFSFGENCATLPNVLDLWLAGEEDASIGLYRRRITRRSSDDDDDDDSSSSSHHDHHHHHHHHSHLHLHRLCRLRNETTDWSSSESSSSDGHVHRVHGGHHHHGIVHDYRHHDWHDEKLPFCDDDDPNVVFEHYEHEHSHVHEHEHEYDETDTDHEGLVMSKSGRWRRPGHVHHNKKDTQ
jgi:hypothetical protein